MGRTAWKCDCPLCRLLVYPVLGKIAAVSGRSKSGKSREVLSKEMAKKVEGRPIEVIKLSETEGGRREELKTQTLPQPPPTPQVPTTQVVQQQPQVQQSQQPKEVQAKEGSKGREETKKVEVTLPREVYERLETLENEIDKIKKYVKASVDGIKATLVDLRSAMAELSNPFNILRKYADVLLTQEEKNEKQGNSNAKQQAYIQPQVVPIIIPLQGIQQAQTQIPLSGERKEEGTKDKKSLGEDKSSRTIDIGLYERLANWVNSLLEKVPLNKFHKLIDNYVSVGLISDEVGNILKKIATTINELKSLGLGIKEQAKYLEELVKTLGISNSSVEKELMKAVKRAEKDVRKDKEESGTEELLKLIEEGEP